MKISFYLILLFTIAFIIFFISLWLISFIGAVTRKDLKENRWLWIFILLAIPPMGVAAYLLKEGKKRLGISFLISVALQILILIYFLFLTFFLI